MPDGFVQLPADGAGKKLKTFVDGASEHLQYVIPRSEQNVTFRGRSSTYRIPGRAGTANQNLFALWNGSAGKIVRVKTVAVDLTATVVKAVTVLPPMIRFYRITSAPVNGVTVTKNAEDTALTSDVAVTLHQDASADGTLAGSALAATASGGALTQEYAPRLITAAGYEMFDRDIFFDTSEVLLRPSQGLLLRLDYTLATQNPATDMWMASIIWTEE